MRSSACRGQFSPRNEAGTVVGLWRYPVKSMLGEELNAAEISDGGVVGDRRLRIVDAATGVIAGAKNPRKWGNFFDYRAAYVEPLRAGASLPAVRVTLPDGTVVTNEQADVAKVPPEAFGRDVEPRRGDGKDGAPRRQRRTGPTWRVSRIATR